MSEKVMVLKEETLMSSEKIWSGAWWLLGMGIVFGVLGIAFYYGGLIMNDTGWMGIGVAVLALGFIYGGWWDDKRILSAVVRQIEQGKIKIKK